MKAIDAFPKAGPVADPDGWLFRIAHNVPGLVDRRAALLVCDPRDPSQAPVYFVLLDWTGDQLTHIRDFRHARYVIEDAEIVMPG